MYDDGAIGLCMPQCTRHAVYELYYLGVFIPKYREPRLTGAAAAGLRSIFGKVCDYKDFELVEANIMPDYVRLFIGSPFRNDLMLIVNWVEGISTRWDTERVPERIKWTGSYYVGSAGNVSKDAVEQYIQEQAEKQA